MLPTCSNVTVIAADEYLLPFGYLVTLIIDTHIHGGFSTTVADGLQFDQNVSPC